MVGKTTSPSETFGYLCRVLNFISFFHIKIVKFSIFHLELELILYYHSCEGSMELAKKTIDLNFTMKAQWKEIFEDFDPKSSKNVHALETA